MDRLTPVEQKAPGAWQIGTVRGIKREMRRQVVLPIAMLLWVASGMVLARALGRGGRLSTLATAAVGAGLTLRGIMGLVWACGIGTLVRLLDAPTITVID